VTVTVTNPLRAAEPAEDPEPAQVEAAPSEAEPTEVEDFELLDDDDLLLVEEEEEEEAESDEVPEWKQALVSAQLDEKARKRAATDSGDDDGDPSDP
jgi:hypothetical protein